MSVCYLDVQDEITDAVARLRVAPDKRVIVVLPPGSRIGTSRINFRLLLREAETRAIELDVVSGDAEVRALALSAGIPSYPSVPTAERRGEPESVTQPLVPAPHQPPAGEAFAGGSPGPGPRTEAAPTVPYGYPGGMPTPQERAVAGARGIAATAAGIRRGRAATAAGRTPPPPDPRWTQTETGTFAVMPRAASGSGERGSGDAWTGDVGRRPGTRTRSRKRRGFGRILGWGVRLAIVGVVLGVIAYAAYLYLPTATISLKPGTQPFGPVTFVITADPAVGVADAATGTVPAERVPIPLAETGTFAATGHDIIQTKATGTVTFTSTNTFFDVPIPEGTQLSAANGIQFATTAAAVLPKASINQPSTVDVAVRAANAGPTGNVGANTITTAPQSITDLLVSVTNRDPTTGGRRTETVTVTQGDYDAALSQLNNKLNSDLQAAIVDPATTPRGLTLYPATAALGRVTPSARASDLVGMNVGNFDLSVDAPATVLAVDTALVGSVAGDKLLATAPKGVRIFPETVTTQLSPGSVSGTTITFQVGTSARQYTPLDPSQLEDRVRGKTVSEAQSILGQYGTVAVAIWPDFIPTIPNDLRRINLTIENPEIPR